MSDIDPYQGSPMFVGIPYKIWKELEEVMQYNGVTRGEDVGKFTSIICVGAVTDYIHSKRKEKARKQNGQQK
jgi:hypothetical protein